MAVLMLTVVGFFAVAAGHAAASNGEDAIQAHTQRDLSWRRQLSSGNWQVRFMQRLAFKAFGSWSIPQSLEKVGSNPKLQSVCTGGFGGSVASALPLAARHICLSGSLLLRSCVTTTQRLFGSTCGCWPLHHLK